MRNTAAQFSQFTNKYIPTGHAFKSIVGVRTCRECVAALSPRLDGDVISDVVWVDGAPDDGRVATCDVHVVDTHVERLVAAQQNCERQHTC